jgi:hypothetical protein
MTWHVFHFFRSGGRPIRSIEDMEAAAVSLQRASRCHAVLVKGGHQVNGQGPGEQCGDEDSVTDVLFDGNSIQRLQWRRIHTANTHGTGEQGPKALRCLFLCTMPTLWSFCWLNGNQGVLEPLPDQVAHWHLQSLLSWQKARSSTQR